MAKKTNAQMTDCIASEMKTKGCDKATAMKTCEAKYKEKASDKFIGVFPFQFDEEAGETGVAEIPDTIHLIPIGQWQHDAYGPITITASDIREFVQNFNAGIRKGVPITAGHEGMMELPAVGWIQKVEARDDGLWGTVAWTELGEEALEDRQYKFFSPEFYRDYEDPQDHQIYRNVITGGALTKAPYFKELEAVVFSEKIIKKFNEKTMTIAELLAKKMEELSDEEKTFIKEHASELTEEQKTAYTSIIEEPKAETEEEKTAREAKEKADADAKAAEEAKAKADADAKATADANVAAGLNADGTAKVSGSEKVQISMSELTALRAKADAGAQAYAELQKAKLDSAVSALTFSETNKVGKFLPKSKDTLRAFMETLNEAQKTSFTALLAELPKVEIFSEKGVDTKAAEGTAEAEVEAKVNKKMSENKDMKYSDALKLVMSENKGLEERYDSELQTKVVA